MGGVWSRGALVGGWLSPLRSHATALMVRAVLAVAALGSPALQRACLRAVLWDGGGGACVARVGVGVGGLRVFVVVWVAVRHAGVCVCW